jgi:hypothetical protein
VSLIWINRHAAQGHTAMTPRSCRKRSSVGQRKMVIVLLSGLGSGMPEE